MNKELFQSMQNQMAPSPQVRTALSEKLVLPVKKRPAPWMKYGAVAACAALVIGAFSVYGLSKDRDKWIGIVQEFNPSILKAPLHSYVTVEGLSDTVAENTVAANDGTLAGGSGDRLHAPSGALPGGAYIGDAPVQEEAVNAYQILMERFAGRYPDWYGGAYINSSNWLVVQLVSSQDPGDKSLELQVLDWTKSDCIMFSSVKYSLAHLTDLMDQLNRLPDTDPECGKVMAGWGTNETDNRIELTLTEVNDHVLAVLAKLDPEDDAILVQIGERASLAVGEDLIADEPWVDSLPELVERLPEELPESKLPAVVQSVPEEDVSASTSSFDPNSGFSSSFSGSQS